MSEQTIKCKICGEPYKVYMFTTNDQSACPTCVRKAESRQPFKITHPNGDDLDLSKGVDMSKFKE